MIEKQRLLKSKFQVTQESVLQDNFTRPYEGIGKCDSQASPYK
jgi:hypothetical protein